MKWMYDWLMLPLGQESFTLLMKERERGREKEGGKRGRVGRHCAKCLLSCLQKSRFPKDLLQGAL